MGGGGPDFEAQAVVAEVSAEASVVGVKVVEDAGSLQGRGVEQTVAAIEARDHELVPDQARHASEIGGTDLQCKSAGKRGELGEHSGGQATRVDGQRNRLPACDARVAGGDAAGRRVIQAERV